MSWLRWAVVTVALVAGLLVWPLARQVVDLGATRAPTAREGVLRIVGSIRAAQSTYRSVHGYYDRLECLVQDSCVPNPYPPAYLAHEATRHSAYGYRLRLVEGPGVRVETAEFVSPTGMTAYAFTAVPVDPGSSGRPSFCADPEGVYEYADGRLPAVLDGRCVDRSVPVPDGP